VGLNILGNFYFTVRVPGERLRSVAVGHKEAYLINEKHQCFLVEFEQATEVQHELTAKQFQPFEGRKIMRVSSGYNFFVAFQRDVEVMEEWDT
jgi:hypothetical protein